MKSLIKNVIWLSLVAIFLLIAFGSSEDEEDTIITLKTENLVGNSYKISCYKGDYTRLKFESNTRYSIYKYYKGKGGCCTGYGKWSIKNNKIVLGSNDSGAETVRDYKGEYKSYYFSCSGGYYANCGGSC